MVHELAMPQAVLRETSYDCRSTNDSVNWQKSARLFNNPTKQDRYGAQKYWALPGGIIPITHGDATPVPPTASARAGASVVNIPRPGGDGVKAHVGIRPVYERPLEQQVRVAGLSAAANQAPA
jgi:hypothetical protein